MSAITAVIDVEQLIHRENGVYILQGWCVSQKPQAISFQVRADSRQVPFEVVQYPRPDVMEARKDLQPANPNIGFRITITHLEELMESAQNLRVRIVQGEEKEPLLQKSMEELKEAYKEAAIRYHIDILEQDGPLVQIQGWCIDALQEEHMEFVDENGKRIPCTTFSRVIRNDVNQEEQLPLSYPCGFVLTVPRKEITGKQIRLKFWNSLTSKEAVIDMKKFDYDNSMRGRVLREIGRKNFRRNRLVWKGRGTGGFLDFLRDQIYTDTEAYAYHQKKRRATARQLKEQSQKHFTYHPKISIVVPLYNTPLVYLKAMIDSVQAQSYSHWELCLADGSTKDEVGDFIWRNYKSDHRIRYEKIQKNEGISGNTNYAIRMAEGDFLMFADHDDTLEPDALYEMVRVLNEHPDTDIIYTDEDLMNSDGTVYSSPRFKPDFNFDFLRCINYICHIFLVRKKLADEVGLLDKAYDGAQDYDFILRCCERTKGIRHIPRILYHWRAHEDSTAGNPKSKEYAIDAGKRALEAHYKRMGYDAVVEYTGIFIVYRTIMKVKGNPKVSIIIPNKDHIDDLDTCIRSVEEKTSYRNFEIIVVENNSEQKETFLYYDQICREYDNIKVVTWKGEFNYSAINNYGASFAQGEYFVLLNNDIEVISPDWMSEMLGFCQRENTGIVGAKLYYSDDTVQHAGVVVGLGGFAGHILTRFRKGETGYFGRLVTIQDVSAVTAACLMVKRSSFEQVGGFDEKFVVALNDIDLCLKVRSLGQLVVMNPWAEMYHYESKSRGMEDTPEKKKRFMKEIKRFRQKWKEILTEGDPYYNVNLSLEKGDCSLRGNSEYFQIIEEIEKGIEE